MQQGWTIEQRKEMFLEYVRDGRATYCPLDHTRIQVRKLDQVVSRAIIIFACPTCQRAFQSNELI